MALQGNAEYQAEKTAEKRKNEDAFTMYLDKPAKEMKPWYSQVDMISSGDLEISERKKRVKEQAEEKALSLHDPMTTMNALLKRRKEVKAERERRKSTSPRSSSRYNGQYNPDETRRAHRHDPLRDERRNDLRYRDRRSQKRTRGEQDERHADENKSYRRRSRREDEHSHRNDERSHKDDDFKRKDQHKHRSKHH